MKKLINAALIYLAAIVLGVLLFFLGHYYATHFERAGNFALGGELFLPLIPPATVYAVRLVKRERRELRERNTSDENRVG